MTRWRISGFADEAHTDFGEQLRFFAGLGLERIDIRHFARDGARCSIAESTAAERAMLARQLRGSGIVCHCVAAPVGKAPLDGDFAVQRRQLANALAAALEFGCRAVRIFGFQPAGAADHPRCIESLARLGDQARRDAPGVRLLLENERDVYGETPEQILEALDRVGADNLGFVCDPANFAVVGISAPAAVRELLPRIEALHVKDLGADGSMTLPGRGLCDWPQILGCLNGSADLVDLSLEPHLDVAERHFGSTDPRRFAAARTALGSLLSSLG